MQLKEMDENTIDLELAKKILTENITENIAKCDLIFTFGCPGKMHRKARVDRAVSLYQQGFGRKILFSGGCVKDVIEAKEMKQKALQLGVQEKDILTEETSKNTTENIIASLYTIEKELHLGLITSILFVSDPSHIKRCLLTAHKYLPPFIKCYYAVTDYTLLKEREESLIQEAKKIIIYAKKGYIKDTLDT